jgi:hypothetical protein
VYTNKEKKKEYQREWQVAWRKKHPGSRSKYTKKITTILDLRKVKRVDTPKERFIGKNRCQKCEIKIGKGHIEEKLYSFRGKKLCGSCYEERNRHYN